MKDGDIVLSPGYTLYDTMSATELFDAKIDVKLDLRTADTPQRLLAEGRIVPADQLSLEQVTKLIDNRSSGSMI
jgi:hypothetical protein